MPPRGQFSLFHPHVSIPVLFRPFVAELMSWKDKGELEATGGRVAGVQVESSVMNAGKLRTKSRL